MTIKLVCSACHKSLKVSERFAGRSAPCPNCQTTIHVPATNSDDEARSEEHSADRPSSKSSREKVSSSQSEALSNDVAEETSEEDGSYRLSSSEAESADEEYRPRLKKKPKKVPAVRHREWNEPVEDQTTREVPGGQRRSHWLLALALLPLMASLIWTENQTFAERLQKTVESHPEILPQIESLSEQAGLEELFDVLPGQKLEGAHLSRRTWMHWLYAAASIGAFLCVLTLLFPEGRITPARLLTTGLVTGTVGILLLLAFQWLAMFTQGFNVRGRGIAVLLFYLVKFIGFSYRCALEEGNGFLLSFMGFTCGVGLCEEVCKAIPIAIFLRSARQASWQGACVVGLASGVGFGVSEGITYSADFYNGISGIETYLVRFISCVALHALWSGCVALLMFNNQDNLSEFDWENVFGFVIHYLLISMLLHGLYDTLLKQDQPLWALLVAVASFGWFAVMFARQETSSE